MANTAVKVSASPNHLTLLLTGDGTVVGPTIDSAALLADMEGGPLKNAWSQDFRNQADMRAALLGGLADCEASIQLVTAVADVTAEVNQIAVDVDQDAVDANKAEINIGMSDTTGQLAYLHLKHRHSLTQ